MKREDSYKEEEENEEEEDEVFERNQGKFKKHRISIKEKYEERLRNNDSEGSNLDEPKRKRGVIDTPNMDVVIGYNIFPDGLKNRTIPMILLNEEPIPNGDDFIGFPGFEGVNECKKIQLRHVPGNNFFFELVKTNASHERIFLVCEPKFGSRLLNLSGRTFNILFVGRQGKEVIGIRPCPNTKETVSILYKGREIGRIIRHSSPELNEPSHTILDYEGSKLFILQKSYQLIPRSTCCITTGKQKIPDGYQIFYIKDDIKMDSVGTIKDTIIKFISPTNDNQRILNVLDKTILLATHVSIKTKAMESAGIAQRISMSFSSISIS